MYNDDYDDYDEDAYYDEYDAEEDLFSCDYCGPWCPEWAGDGLCNLAIEAHADNYEDFMANQVLKDVRCQVCGAILDCYEIPTDELWTWPGDFYDPLVGLTVYAAYGAPKGELHRQDNVCHIWIGEGDQRDEKLIKLNYRARAATTQEDSLPS